MKLVSDWLHAHVYFDEHTRPEAERFQKEIAQSFIGKAKVYRLIDRPIGPHPQPMFEVDFPAEHYEEVVAFLRERRGRLNVLVHQVTPDEVWDHTEGAEWLGTKVVLDIQYLKDFMAGKIPPVGSTIQKS